MKNTNIHFLKHNIMNTVFQKKKKTLRILINTILNYNINLIGFIIYAK